MWTQGRRYKATDHRSAEIGQVIDWNLKYLSSPIESNQEISLLITANHDLTQQIKNNYGH